MGVYGIMGSIGWGIGPIASGYVYDNLAPVGVWYLAVGLAIAGTVAFAIIGRTPSLTGQDQPAPAPWE